MSTLVPLCVDLDGSLTPVDTLHESLLTLVKSSPLDLFRVPAWIGRGKAAFKREVVARAPVDADCLPLNGPLVDYLKAEKATGRPIVLVTASDRRTADAVAAHAGFFDQVIASDGEHNLSGEDKRQAIVERFGEKGFDYVGNDAADLRVWPSARNAIVCGPKSMAAKAARLTTVVQHFEPAKPGLETWIRAARLHQWVKNALIFLPPLLAHRITDVPTMLAAVLAFVAFGLCASSVYLFNDLLDLSSDRRHARKRKRPFASGALPAKQGVIVGGLLLAASAALAATINVWFCAALATYYVLTWAYSLRLKRIALIDVMMLAGLYTMRIIAGSAATLITPSFWLLGFSVFMFLSLGIVKRYAELYDVQEAGKSVAHGRGYSPGDLTLLQSLGTASGYTAIVVLALYVNAAASMELYHHPKALWAICPVMLYWISRVWLLTSRGEMHDDPIVFALRDRLSLVLALLMGVAAFFAL